MRTERYKKTIAVDFDGTLVHGKWPACEDPDMRLIRFILKHRNDYIWILWTSRTGEDLEAAVRYMQTFGITFDYVNENSYQAKTYFGGNARKIWATYYIDDKSATLGKIIRDRIRDRFRRRHG